MPPTKAMPPTRAMPDRAIPGAAVAGLARSYHAIP